MEHNCPHCQRSVTTKRGLKSHIAQKHPSSKQYNDPDWMYEQYIECERSMVDISDELGCSVTTIHRALENHGIETRSTGYYHRKAGMPYKMGPYGRMVWRSTRGEDGEKVAYGYEVHRLLAISEYGFDAVAGKDIHHKNGIPWDNRPDNIEPLSKEEHGRIHSHEYYNKND